MTVSPAGPYTHGGYGSYGPFVATDSSRKESQRGLDFAYSRVREDERTDTDDDTTRARDLTNEIDWDEKIVERRELLDQECCDFIKRTATVMLDRHNTGNITENYDQLRDRAYEAWCKACNVPDELLSCVDSEVQSALSRWECRIARLSQGYARAAGSSLNSAVQDIISRDYQLLEIELMGVYTKYKADGLQLRQQALSDAYQMYRTAHLEWSSDMASNAINLLTVLRGSKDDFMRDHTHDEIQVTDDDEVTNRDIREERDRDVDSITAGFKWQNAVINVANGSQTYTAIGDDTDAAVDTLTGGAGGLLGTLLPVLLGGL